MTDNYIRLKEHNTLKLGIVDSKGNDTGEFLEFDLADTGLLLKYQELMERDDKNKKNLSNQIKLIDKRPDISGKKFLSKNEEDKLRALEDFFVEEEKIYDLFLGEGGVKKLLQGRKLGWTTIQEIDDIISEQIAPKLTLDMETIKKNIVNKYSVQKEEKTEL